MDEGEPSRAGGKQLNCLSQGTRIAAVETDMLVPIHDSDAGRDGLDRSPLRCPDSSANAGWDKGWMGIAHSPILSECRSRAIEGLHHAGEESHAGNAQPGVHRQPSLTHPRFRRPALDPQPLLAAAVADLLVLHERRVPRLRTRRSEKGPFAVTVRAPPLDSLGGGGRACSLGSAKGWRRIRVPRLMHRELELRLRATGRLPPTPAGSPGPRRRSSTHYRHQPRMRPRHCPE